MPPWLFVAWALKDEVNPENSSASIHMDISIKLTYKSCPNSFMHVINFKWTPTADTCKEEKKISDQIFEEFYSL